MRGFSCGLAFPEMRVVRVVCAHLTSFSRGLRVSWCNNKIGCARFRWQSGDASLLSGTDTARRIGVFKKAGGCQAVARARSDHSSQLNSDVFLHLCPESPSYQTGSQ